MKPGTLLALALALVPVASPAYSDKRLAKMAQARADEYVLSSRRVCGSGLCAWEMTLLTAPPVVQAGRCTSRIRSIHVFDKPHRPRRAPAASEATVVFEGVSPEQCAGKPAGDLLYVEGDAIAYLDGALAAVRVAGLDKLLRNNERCARMFPSGAAALRLRAIEAHPDRVLLRYGDPAQPSRTLTVGVLLAAGHLGQVFPHANCEDMALWGPA